MKYLNWALEPSRLTDRVESTAGLIPVLKRFALVYIWPSVIEITLVAIYSVTSQLIVSIIGKAVITPDGIKNLDGGDGRSVRHIIPLPIQGSLIIILN